MIIFKNNKYMFLLKESSERAVENTLLQFILFILKIIKH